MTLLPSPSDNVLVPAAEELKALEESLQRVHREIQGLRESWERQRDTAPLVQSVGQQIRDLTAQTQKWEESQKTVFHSTVETLQQQWQSELKTLEKAFHEEQIAWGDLVKQKETALEKLAEELARTQQALTRWETLEAARLSEARRSFFSKLWNYLNQTVIELPALRSKR